MLNATTADIRYERKTILTGMGNPANGLWQVDLQSHDSPESSMTQQVHACKAFHLASTIATRMAWLHECAFSPAKSTFLKAIKVGHFMTWPDLIEKLVCKHLPELRAMRKGHLGQTKQNLRSMQPAVALARSEVSDTTEEDDDSDPAFTPSQEPNTPALTHAIYAASMPITGQVFSDATGRFVMPFNKGNMYILVIHDEDSNCIFVQPLKSGKAAQHLKAYSRIHALLMQ